MKLSLNDDKLELFLQTAIWNSIEEEFMQRKGIDVNKYIVSVRISSNRIYIKTNSPTFKNEIFMYEDKILERFYKKIKNLEFIVPDFQVFYS